jgi:hypothetical protein
MAAPKQQLACFSSDLTGFFQQCAAPDRAMVSVNREDASKVNTRNIIIIQFFMLVLLLPMQAVGADKMIDRPAVLELAATTPVSTPGQSENTANEDIRTNAAAKLTAVTAAGFIKIANTGEPLDAKADRWECVEDKSSKLTWEVKKNDDGIRDKDHSYSWLRVINGENTGASNGGRCKGGIKCDTYSYVRAMNEQKLCGYSDWRLPTREEMETLVDYKTTEKDATINKTYFPEAVPSWYWTASENPRRENFAWYVLFRNGVALNDLKERPKHIRLVRGSRAQ